MKRSIYLLSIMTVFAALVSCESNLMLYDGETGVYFAMPTGNTAVNADTTYTETSSLPFIVEGQDVTERTFHLKIKILGAVADHDRTVTVRMIQEESTVLAEDFEPLQSSYTLKAGTVFGSIPIRFYRAGLKGQERKMVLELVPNEDFSLPITQWKNSSTEYVSVTRHTIMVSDKYVRLPGYQTGYFGPFSERKMEVLVEEAKIVTLDELKEKMSYVKAKSLGQEFDRWLKKMKADNKTVYEADGKTEMTAGEYIYQ